MNPPQLATMPLADPAAAERERLRAWLPGRFSVRCLVGRRKDGWWAIALDFTVAGAGNTAEEAQYDLSRRLWAHVQAVYEKGAPFSDALRPAGLLMRARLALTLRERKRTEGALYAVAGIDEIGRRWEQASKQDSLYYIAADPSKRGGGWTPSEFFAHGRAEIDHIIRWLDEVAPNRMRGRALDFGCGVGRCAEALARHYTRVDGVDISPGMIGQARELTPDSRCFYHVNAQPDLWLFKDEAFDLVYSANVLQHMPENLVRGYVSEIFRILKPDGLAVLDIKQTGAEENVTEPWMSVYPLAAEVVRGWIAESGGVILAGDPTVAVIRKEAPWT